jgi:hypothetical protein
MASIEIIDRVGRNGGTDITFNYTTLAQLNPAEFRAFFLGRDTVAQYHFNAIATLESTNSSAIPGETDYNYTITVTSNNAKGRALQVGDRVEIEISQFLLNPRHGRNNYYGTAILYVVGQGIVPWEGVGSVLDSYPLSTNAWLGGLTTLPYQYSDEPQHLFKQTAGNIAPTNGQPFMLGRRLHHTDFGNGVHSEPDNPVFTAQIGKLGPAFMARSCVECHVNNGRALPPAVGADIGVAAAEHQRPRRRQRHHCQLHNHQRPLCGQHILCVAKAPLHVYRHHSVPLLSPTGTFVGGNGSTGGNQRNQCPGAGRSG